VPRRFKTLDEWLAWFETLHPKKIDFSLDRIRRVLDTLGLAVPPYAVVTVGGTNGKGSCVALLEAVYRAAAYRVGAFTSPHLVRFNERIRVDGHDVSDRALISLFERIDAALGPLTLSYFESSAVAALLHFADCSVDVAVLEVGMGGRLDAVNVYDADGALIVNVDLEHQEWLGPDREAIGREKAGIMRRGRPAVVADRHPPASVLRAAEETGARLQLIGRDFDGAPAQDGFVYRTAPGSERHLPRPAFGGDEQIDNAAGCARLVECLHERLPVADGALVEGLGAARVQGRVERHVIDGVEWILDVAHNPAAAARLHASLRHLPAVPRTVAVFAAMRDKALGAVLEPFRADVDHWFVSQADSERAASTDALIDALASLGGAHGDANPAVAAAGAAARAATERGERVLVFGSFYTVGPALAALEIYCALCA
jgi:dihydrofolate synthase/folylpolyglutamate synthase